LAFLLWHCMHSTAWSDLVHCNWLIKKKIESEIVTVTRNNTFDQCARQLGGELDWSSPSGSWPSNSTHLHREATVDGVFSSIFVDSSFECVPLSSDCLFRFVRGSPHRFEAARCWWSNLWHCFFHLWSLAQTLEGIAIDKFLRKSCALPSFGRSRIALPAHQCVIVKLNLFSIFCCLLNASIIKYIFFVI